MKFDWTKNLHLEDKNKRTHITKDFPHPTNPTKRILIQSSGLLHYFDKEFKDIPDLKFPEGKEIIEEKDKHFMMDLPDWGETKVEKNGKQVRVYDKKNQPIYVFKNPLVVEKGKNPYKIVDKDSKKVKETKNRKESLTLGEKIEKSEDAIEAIFEVENNKLYFKLPQGLNYPLEAYDDTDTSSTNNKDTTLFSGYSGNNYGNNVSIFNMDYSGGALIGRGLIHFTLVADPGGTITDVTLHLYNFDETNKNTQIFNVHPLDANRYTWVEGDGSQPCSTGATWDEYICGTSSWTAGGGDYGAIIDGISFNIGVHAWQIYQLMGDSDHAISGTPLSLDWDDELHLVTKMNQEGQGDGDGCKFYSKDTAESQKPYILITYTPVAGPAVKSVNSIAIASVKSINTVAIADVKSVNSIT